MQTGAADVAATDDRALDCKLYGMYGFDIADEPEYSAEVVFIDSAFTDPTATSRLQSRESAALAL